ncbi:ParB/RepB/Spo0J family partition protein [Solibaculum mannosilyticum]|uniref:Chromosome partitioning protein ParB n=1 Tax=Solibaculum mannosilyticum TaxID=2780922 RepID=A0A7I8D440_9FIRM|nr:ParB/RepB/Spo0J family partition protein [Solibaculum mannosilyticum]BCI61591.1 chromosome partitioning protein ParB [Solibaculum mannosilyticum]CZT56165.1 Chromosome-partitioning protein Spo0J [Eubacteriaceae bacterium CHKCI005]
MASKKRGLGKGLDALFMDNAAEDQGAVQLRLDDIEPNRDQPRRTFDEEALAELADSISQHGVIQPLLVRPMAGGGYQLVAGERRWRASRMAGLTEVPVVIREMSDAEMMEIAMVENLQREDLNAIEEAEGYRMLMERCNLTQEEAAKRVGKSRPAVANAVRLLNLPDNVQQYVKDGKLSAGHARTLLGFEDTADLQDAAQLVVEKGLSVRELERLAKKSRQTSSAKPAGDGSMTGRASLYDEVELSLTEHLGRRVKVHAGAVKGSLEIEFYSQDDLQELANAIGGMPSDALRN